ncbi:MAG: 30S ribosomal protein S17e [Nitrososphaerota archaeon]
MDRIRRLALQLINEYHDKFSSDYENNKKVLTEIAIFRSKSLRNEVAGYISRYYKLKQEEEEEGKEEQAVAEKTGAAASS